MMFYALCISYSLLFSLFTVQTGLEAKSPTSAISQHPPLNYISNSHHILVSDSSSHDCSPH